MLAGSAAAVGDASFAEVVGGQFDGDLVAWQDADEMEAHFAADVGDDFMSVFEGDQELGVGQQFFYDSINFYAVFGHTERISGLSLVINI